MGKTDFSCSLQASAYEACNHMHMPLHIPKTLEMCKKSMPCLIKKALRCVADCTSKATLFMSTFYKIQRSYEKIMCICYFISSVVNDGAIIFLMSCFSFLSDTRQFHVLNKFFSFLSTLAVNKTLLFLKKWFDHNI